MSYYLFLDDERAPPRDGRFWVNAQSFEQFQHCLHSAGMPDFISFDHDLGEVNGKVALTGMDCARWLCEYIMDNDLDVSGFDWYVHSQNPIGAANINGYLSNFIRVYTG